MAKSKSPSVADSKKGTFISGSESGGAKCPPTYEGADELQRDYESKFLKNKPAVSPN